MNLESINWNKEEYNKFIQYLDTLKDEKYKNFHKKLLNSDISLIGIRTPILKEIAKKISRGDYQSFIGLNKHNTYEEILIHGLIIGYLNLEFEDIIKLIEAFIPYINNWAINDIASANLKIFKKNQKKGFLFINKNLKSKNPWKIRFSLTLLISFYINDDYIDRVISIIKSINSNEYYVKMANAWLISICYIKYEDKAIKLFEYNLLDDWTNNKAITKINDSYRVSIQNKCKLKKFIKNLD